MTLPSHWRRLNRAFDHIETLDRSVRRWLDSDAYRVVEERDPEIGKTAYVARVGDVPDDWSDLVSEAIHHMRSALEHLAFALNAKGYAEAHKGAAIPPEREANSSFPIFGNVNQRGQPMDGERAFKANTSYADMPSGAKGRIEELQPYKRGKDFRQDPLWAIHELSRVDRHRIEITPTASCPESLFSVQFEAVAGCEIGFTGPVEDGKELSWWIVPPGKKEPDADLYFARGVAFGQSTPLGDQPLVPTLRGIRNYLRYNVALSLDSFL